MGTVTFGDDAVTVARNRPGDLPMQWQETTGQPIDITGFVITAEMRWRDGDSRPVPAAITDAAGGAFVVTWDAALVADLPLGRIAVLAVKIIDGADGTHDLILPIRGVEP